MLDYDWIGGVYEIMSRFMGRSYWGSASEIVGCRYGWGKQIKWGEFGTCLGLGEVSIDAY